MILSLGTAQLGLKYGIANRVGMLSTRQAFEILDAAWRNDIHALDTAPSYGKSEERIGKYLRRYPSHDFHVTTKISVLDGTHIDTTSGESKKRLGKIDSILYHCLGCDEQAINTLDPRYADGISLYNKREISFTHQGFKSYQMPYSALDQRNDFAIKYISAIGIKVQARSLLLQGLVAFEPEDCPIVGAAPYLEKLRKIASDYSMNIIELCVRWVWELPISVAIVGAETVKQVEQIAEYYSRGLLPRPLAKRVYKVVDRKENIPEMAISPRMWGAHYDFTFKEQGDG